MLVDVHLHSEYSDDAGPDASVRAICQAAVRRGLSVITLTDHKEFFFTRAEAPLDLAARRRDIERCQQEFEGQLTLLCGIELGQIHASGSADTFLRENTFDEVIGSLHVYRKNDTDIYFQDFDTLDGEKFLHDYFADLLVMVRHGGFDILAHLDYPLRVMKRPGNHPTIAGFEAEIEPVLREIIDREIALEINAAGLFSWQGTVGPPSFVLEMYKNLGGSMITLGSDSHCAADVGRGIETCAAYAKEAGFRETVIYKERRPVAVAL